MTGRFDILQQTQRSNLLRVTSSTFFNIALI
jgi:hypothetical protein